MIIIKVDENRYERFTGDVFVTDDGRLCFGTQWDPRGAGVIKHFSKKETAIHVMEQLIRRVNFSLNEYTTVYEIKLDRLVQVENEEYYG